MDYVIKAELPEGHPLHGQCRYYRQEGFQFTDEFERATRFETLKEANAMLPKCREVLWRTWGSGMPMDKDFAARWGGGGASITAECSVVCC